jgi:opacity protein-like surface antigen
MALAAILLAGSGAGAQGWEGGVKTGLSRVETGSQEFEWSATSSSAVFLKRGIGGPFAIQPEMAYVRRSGVSIVSGSTLRLVADYVELPIMLQAGVHLQGGFSPYVTVGPSFAFRLRCRLQFVGGGLSTDDNCENQQGRRSSVFDLGMAAGAGFGWAIGMTTLSIESRMTGGLLKSVLPTDVSDARSVGWSVLAGASIPLGKRQRMPPVWMPPLAGTPTIPAAPSAPMIAQPARPSLALDSRTRASGRRVTLTADNADAREVLIAIGSMSGLPLIVSSQIRSRVSTVLVDIPA